MRLLYGTLLYISLQLWIIPSLSSGQERIIILSQDAKYIEIDPGNLSITDVGSVWHLKIFEIDDTIDNTSTNDILVVTKIWQQLNVQNPSRELFETRGLAVLQRPDKGGGLLLRAFIQPPAEGFSLSGGKPLKVDDTLLFLTWDRNTSTTQESIVAAYDHQYRLVKTFPGQFYVVPRSWLSPRTGLINTPQFGPWGVLTLDPSSGTEDSVSYGNIGSATYFSKTVIASQGCKVLIIERSSRESQDSAYYLYDFDAKRLISTFRNRWVGDYFLVDDKQLILIDERRDVLGPGGANETHKPGRLHVLKYSGEEIGVAELPVEGRVVAINRGGTSIIYSAPGSISLIDLLDLKVRTLKIPFSSFKVGAWNAK